MDLGQEVPDYSDSDCCMPSSPKQPTKTKIQYPTFSVQDNPELLKQVVEGGEITATVKLKVTSMESHTADADYRSKDGSTVQFAVINLEVVPEQKSKPKGALAQISNIIKNGGL